MLRVPCCSQFWYLPAPPIDHPPEVSLDLISLTKTTPERKNFTFHMKSEPPSEQHTYHTNFSLFPKVPRRVSIFIGPRSGHKLAGWSFLDKVTPPIPCNHKNPLGDQCFFIFYARGAGVGSESFWLELEVELILILISWSLPIKPNKHQYSIPLLLQHKNTCTTNIRTCM